MNLDIQILTWVMTSIGFAGFIFVGRKLWWAWYINLGVQILWAIYALATGQPAFLASAVTYFLIFALNAYKWTHDERKARKLRDGISQLQVGGTIIHGGVELTRMPDPYPGWEASNFQTKEEWAQKHEEGLTDDYNVELIARVCHEANRVLQLSHDDENPSYPWHLAQDWQKESAMEGVRAALDGATAEELHESWCRHKFAKGWVYGEFKDEGIKTHPCLVPYDKLPEEQRIKDHMFRAIVKSFKIHKQYANVPAN